MINNEVIATVRNRANILEVVSQVVVLKRIGKDYKGLCPFHKEKTPSFHVHPEKGIYKCFGCGEGGDVFAFVQKARGLGFLDGVKELAHQFGVSLLETEQEKTEYKRRSLFLLLYEQACEFYCKLLKDPITGNGAQQYLKSRGLDETTIQKFRLGYAPASWDALTDYLCSANKVSAATLEEAGLSRARAENNGYFDLFRHRLIIPISDEQGRVIAFGGRTLGDDQVKYLNSPESLIYTKGEHLFAFAQAKEAIKAKDSVVAVEGYFDAITAHQFGFTNTVATLGTALSNEQGKLLVRHTDSKRVYLAFDADNAGIKATEKGAQILEQLAAAVGLDLRVIKILGSKDPDECLRAEEGVALFSQALENSQTLLEYELEQATSGCNIQTRDGRIEASRKVVPILARINSAVVRSEYIRQLANKFDIQEDSLATDVASTRKTGAAVDSKRKEQSIYAEKGIQMNKAISAQDRFRPADGLLEAERLLIASFLCDKTDYELAYKSLGKEELMTTAHSKIIKAIYQLSGTFNSTTELESKLLDHFASEPAISSALVEIVLKAEQVTKQQIPIPVLLLQSRVKLMKERILALTKTIRNRLTSSNDSNETSLLQSKISELNRLERLTLPTIEKMTEIDDLLPKIKEITLSLENSTGEHS